MDWLSDVSGMMTKFPRPLAAALLGGTLSGSALIVAVPAPALAQTPTELAEARNAFREGLSLEAAGNWAAALRKFEQVAQVKLTPQVRFHIARCKEHLGRLNEALGEYRIAEYEADQQSLSEADEMKASREQLEARIPRVMILREGDAAQSRIKLDGVQLGEASLAGPVTVDPGAHRLEATSLNGQVFETQFVAEENKTATVSVKFEEGSPATPPKSEQAPPQSGVEDKPNEGGIPAGTWLLAGVGVAAIGGGVFGLIQAGKAKDDQAAAQSRIGDLCVREFCHPAVDTADVDALEQAQGDEKMFTGIGYAGLGVGALALGVAAYLWIDSDSDDAQALGEGVFVSAQPGDARVLVRGSF